MNDSLKSQNKSHFFRIRSRFKNLNIILLLVILGVLAGFPFIFEIKNQETRPASEDSIPLSGREKLIILQGNTLSPLSTPLTSDFKVAQKINVIVTAYSSSVWETDNSPQVTASGEWVKEGIVANNLLPFGTKIKMPEIYGNKVFTVEDRMHWRKGYYHVDIWLSSYSEARDFGSKRTYIEVLES